jgi:hypothetical protein
MEYAYAIRTLWELNAMKENVQMTVQGTVNVLTALASVIKDLQKTTVLKGYVYMTVYMGNALTAFVNAKAYTQDQAAIENFALTTVITKVYVITEHAFA